MPVKKKVKEPTGIYQPFWTPEKVELFGASTLRNFAYRDPGTTLYYNNDTHLPFFVLPRMETRCVETLHYHLSGNNGESVPPFVAALKAPGMSKFLTALWKAKKYQHFMLASELRLLDTGITTEEMTERLKKVWDKTMAIEPDVSLYFPMNNSCKGGLNTIKCMTLGTHFGIGAITSKTVRTGPWARPKYLFGRYFLSYLQPLESTQVFQHGGPAYETTASPVALASLMFKVEHLNLIRGYMLNNKEIPAELLEMWVDKSLIAIDTPHPVRLQFNKLVRKPMEEAGIAIKEVDNLDALMFRRMSVPKFKSIKMQNDWKDSLIGTLMNDERKMNGIKQVPVPEKKLHDDIFAKIEQAAVPSQFAAEFLEAIPEF